MRLALNSWVGKIPWRRAWQPTPVFLPGEFHGQSTLVDYSPRDRKEWDTTEATNTFSFIFISKSKTNSGALYFCKLWFLDLLWNEALLLYFSGFSQDLLFSWHLFSQDIVCQWVEGGRSVQRGEELGIRSLSRKWHLTYMAGLLRQKVKCRQVC